jgi:Protein of unknown function (DUF2934)
MDRKQTPLYGELVIASAGEDQPGVQAEVKAMIAEAAYYLAEKRGFVPGYELEDWLKAEAQILK